MGSLFLVGIAVFFVAFLFVAMKNFDSEVSNETVQTANQFQRIKKVSDLQKELIEK